MSKPFRVGRFRAVVDDSGERDGWWIESAVKTSETVGFAASGVDTWRSLFVSDAEIAKLRRLLERVEAYERRRPSRRAA